MPEQPNLPEEHPNDEPTQEHEYPDSEQTVEHEQYQNEMTVAEEEYDEDRTMRSDREAEYLDSMTLSELDDDEPTLPNDASELQEDLDLAEGDDVELERDKPTLTTDMVEVPDDIDVPFRLPHVSELAPEPEDPRKDAHKMVTMPTYRVPGETDPKATLPGTSGRDPNPDMSSEPTMQNPAVNLPPQGQQPHGQPLEATMPNPQFSDKRPPAQPQEATLQNPQFADDVRYQRPQYAQPVPPAPPNRKAPQPPAMPRRRRRRKILGLRPGCFWLVIGLFVTFCGGFTLLSLGAAAIFVPQIEAQWTGRIAEVDAYRGFESTFIYDRHGNLLYEAFGEGRRTRVRYERIPQHLINATLAIEDDSFFENIGIDVPATTVAFLNYLGADSGENTPGGSTITQQLVRNVLFDFEKRAERSVQRKVEEIILAVVLTQSKSKPEILEMYLNEIYYGNLAYGAQTAAQTFFGKDVQDLTIGEAALLAGLPQAPASLDPLNPDPEVQAAVDARWRQVLTEMVEEGYITREQSEQALREGLNYTSPNVSLQAPHFTVYAQGELERLMLELGYSPEDITQGGLRVYTTLDRSINNLALGAARTQVGSLQAKNVSNASVVAIKPLTGEILAMVGSIDYNNDAIDGRVNVATAFRQPGSTMKPFTYSGAIERGLTPGDVIWDTRTEIGIPGQPLYTPRNYDGAFHGPMRMRHALANSYNIPAVQTLRLVGVDYLLDLMHRFGVSTLQGDPSQYGLSLTLGGGEVTLIELTNAYAVFANQGSYVPVTSILCIVDSDDNILYQYENSCREGRLTNQTVERQGFGTQVLDPRIAFIVSDIMSDNAARSAAMGSNSPLRTDGIETSVKTGTTNDVKDNWTVGYTRNLAIGVWVGNNNGDPMVNSSGLTGAAPIWNSVFTSVYSDPNLRNTLAVAGQLQPDKPAPPPGMTLRTICDVRRLTDPATRCPVTFSEWFLDGPAGIPDAEGNLQFPPPNQSSAVPTNNAYIQEVEPGVFRALVFPIPPEIANSIQFTLNPGDKQPIPPKYCRIPVDLANIAPSQQELLFIAGPSTSQADAVEAERFARERGLAFLPTIDCWADVFNAQTFGPAIVQAVITSPTNGQVVNSNTPILGSVQFSPEQARFYKIEILGPGFPDWTTLGDVHYESVNNGQIEFLQAEALQPGTYQLRLAIVDHNSGFLQQPYTISFVKQ